MLEGKTVILGVTGSIAAYKAFSLAALHIRKWIFPSYFTFKKSIFLVIL